MLLACISIAIFNVLGWSPHSKHTIEPPRLFTICSLTTSASSAIVAPHLVFLHAFPHQFQGTHARTHAILSTKY